MEKIKENLELTLLISKDQSYKEHKVLLGLDKEREDKFNNMETIEVSEDELKTIGDHPRWLIKENKNGN